MLNFAKNLGLVFASLAAGTLLLELLTLRVLLPHLPLRLHHHFGAIGILAQPTKRGIQPRDYTLLLGDSFARGFGDWLYLADHGKNSKFHSLHVLRDITGWEIISMGKAGTGSVGSLVEAPHYAFSVINASPFLRLEPPKRIIAYFYEGNDLNNNTSSGGDDIERGLQNADKRIARATIFIKRFGFTLSAVLRILRYNVKLALGKTTPELVTYGPAPSWRKRETGVNLLKLAGGNVFAPHMQGPSPLLPDSYIENGVEVFRQSLEHLRRRFPEAELIVVYIPAVIMSYRHARRIGEVDIQVRGRPRRKVPIDFMEERSDRICSSIKAETLNTGAQFIDSRHHIRDVAYRKLLHGPRDQSHFNQTGYETLARSIVTGLNEAAFPGACRKIRRSFP